ncbi:MAG: ABC transporter ATP-binding protein [Candidatus Dojkabacteria bacterium]
MRYKLTQKKEGEVEKKSNILSILIAFSPFLRTEKLRITLGFIAIVINSAVSIVAPFILGSVIDDYILKRDVDGLLRIVLVLIAMYAVAFVTSYLQIYLMGIVGQNVLFKLRDKIFRKIQSLPLEFFNDNKSGDLISRINNDTDKLNQLFSEVLVRLTGSVFTIVGIGIFIIFVNAKLAAATLIGVVALFVITTLLGPLIRKANKKSLDALGNFSAEIQESLSNFKVIIAFNRRDYFKEKFQEAQQKNYLAAVWAAVANGVIAPIYDFAGNIAQLLILIYGIYLIGTGEVTIGLLISFISYADRFYQPLRIMASLIATLQSSLAAWTRVNEILTAESNLIEADEKTIDEKKSILKFDNVSFGYLEGSDVLKDINIDLDYGKTYALVGPTGGGKSTLASLIARLFDARAGEIYLEGKNLKSIAPSEIAKEIGFILQDPYLFGGTLADNIKYGNDELQNLNSEELATRIKELGLEKVLERFNSGLDVKVSSDSENISLGQKQLIAFLRTILRKPKLLILDEATANIDTITEALLEEIIDKLPKDTTKIIIAHRLNTIKKADQIFFIANGEVTQAKNLKGAVEMIENVKRSS